MLLSRTIIQDALYLLLIAMLTLIVTLTRDIPEKSIHTILMPLTEQVHSQANTSPILLTQYPQENYRPIALIRSMRHVTDFSDASLEAIKAKSMQSALQQAKQVGATHMVAINFSANDRGNGLSASLLTSVAILAP